MEAYHILLGRPYQFDKKTMANDLSSENFFSHKEKKFVFHLSTPAHVLEDRIQMKRKKVDEKKNLYFFMLNDGS